MRHSLFEMLEFRRLMAFDASLPRPLVTPVMETGQVTAVSLRPATELAWVDAFERDVQAAANDRAAADQWLVDLGDADPATLAAQAVTPTNVPGLVLATFADGVPSADTEARYELLPIREKTSIHPRILNLGDPLLPQQWYLDNTGSSGGVLNEDIDIETLWTVSRGTGVVIGIVDDGLQTNHPDLQANYNAALSYDYASGDTNPNHVLTFEGHGTAVAGLVAARGGNNVGISGVAPSAQLAGIRLITSTNDVKEAGALSHLGNDIDIYNNSWGPSDDGVTVEGPGALTAAALRDGALSGRDGLGSIFVWAAGNGGDGDSINYDGYASSRYTIAVGAFTNLGVRADYSERGASMFISAPSDGGTLDPISTDRTGSAGYGSGDYAGFGGTSGAAPLVSGVVALMLQVNPNLGWRDVQQVLARSARKIDPASTRWANNSAGLNVHPDYGYGAVNATAAVNLAQVWSPLGAETSLSTTVLAGGAVPDNSTFGLIKTAAVTQDMTLESVEVKVNVTHPYRGDLEYVLTSPSGTESVLAQTRNDDGDNLNNWTFTTNRLIGERTAGNWTLRVRDLFSGDAGTLDNWQMTFNGTTAPAAAVTSKSFEYQTRQAVNFTFNTDVSPSLSAGDLVLTRNGSAVSVPTTVSWNPSTKTASFVFSSPLADGDYVATLPAYSVGSAGGGISTAQTVSFFALTGDANRDRAVNVTDLGILSSNFRQTGRTWSQGDFNYDGRVDVADLGILSSHFRVTLPTTSSVAFTPFAKTPIRLPGVLDLSEPADGRSIV